MTTTTPPTCPHGIRVGICPTCDPLRAVLIDGIRRGFIECDGDPDDPATRFRLTPAGIAHAESQR